MIFIALALFLLSALFAAMDQVQRFPDRFFPISRLPLGWYTWDLGWRFLFPWNAVKVYQGAKVWLMAGAWYLADGIGIWVFFVSMVLWWAVIRNFCLHTVLTRDDRII